VNWLRAICQADECEMPVAAAALAEVLSVGVTVHDWRSLDTAGRAAVLVAVRAQRLKDRMAVLEDAGQDVSAARVYAQVDGGRAAARLTAQAVGAGVARALRQKHEASGG